ncbi:hypothetical protein [Desulfotalea psychrophila]|uniref:Uncharacterized protein n=1 Tax=Desulfotalea psychrophila (strain LSv54 / DSM 12343) TaxID=177439 RepID=Q6AKG8_DESPS|nr:hypothetical protein [Desulfotalea psychrophila]CAG37157.1 unknown protein [Desulfotalea psychrophila LSv54]
MSDLPEYVKNTLDEWDSISYFAYDCYEKVGRVAVGIEADPDNPAGARLLAFQYDFQDGKPDKKTAQILEIYDPENEIVIQFMHDDGQVQTLKLRTAPDARHPKRIFFFETLRKLSEEPSTVNLSELPAWMIEALEQLDEIKKDQ